MRLSGRWRNILCRSPIGLQSCAVLVAVVAIATGVFTDFADAQVGVPAPNFGLGQSSGNWHSESTWTITEPLGVGIPPLPVLFPQNSLGYFFVVEIDAGLQITIDSAPVQISFLTVGSDDLLTVDGLLLSLETPFGLGGGLIENDGTISLDGGTLAPGLILGVLDLGGDGQVLMTSDDSQIGALGLVDVINSGDHSI